ncbi:MAG: HD domain-containing protein [Clostridiales bacterium]|nr:HD domain-containing protein [Clostridiales bacterium]
MGKNEKIKDMERLQRQLDFILEADKEKNIFRQTYLADGQRKENDAEHCWHLALMALLLKEYSNEEVDLSRVIPMVLGHDLIEIDAGDTYAYDEEGAKTKQERERKAADRIYSLLPEDQGTWLRELWEEFEAYETPEAKFAHVLDNFQPLFLNDASDGRSWTEHQVKKSQIYKRNRRTAEGSETIWAYMETLIDKHIQLGHIQDDMSGDVRQDRR